MKKILPVLLILFLSVVSTASVCSAEERDSSKLSKDIQNIKKEIINLNRDLFILEEDLLFPANTQFSVFLSMDIGEYFSLDSVQIKIDDKIVANHLYTTREAEALKRGGVQRLYLGNLASGEHEIVAFFVGQGPQKRDYLCYIRGKQCRCICNRREKY
ncbi:MAG: AraC family transcriptional regulator [Gammaproteobacteria bacterium]